MAESVLPVADLLPPESPCPPRTMGGSLTEAGQGPAPRLEATRSVHAQKHSRLAEQNPLPRLINWLKSVCLCVVARS